MADFLGLPRLRRATALRWPRLGRTATLRFRLRFFLLLVFFFVLPFLVFLVVLFLVALVIFLFVNFFRRHLFVFDHQGRRLQHRLVFAVAAFDFHSDSIRLALKRKRTVAVLAIMLEDELQIHTTMRAIKLHPHRIHRQRNPAVAFLARAFAILLTHQFGRTIRLGKKLPN